ncbi:MAG: hypothetical protein QF464_22010, partial [Myxococcota bacterium]|nr:hypothetical protein [Myxococcota bacterium]
DHDARLVSTREAISSRWTTAREGALALDSLLGADTTQAQGAHGYVVAAALRDARLSIPDALEAYREAIVGHVEAFRGAELVVKPESLTTLDPLVTRARDHLHDLRTLAMDRRQIYTTCPGSTLAALYRELDLVDAQLDDNAKARTAAAGALDKALREAKRRRDRATGSALADARSRASAAADQYQTRLSEITRRLVSKISVTLSLEATDRGAAAGRADDAPVQTTVSVNFRGGLSPQASASPTRRTEPKPRVRKKGTCEPTQLLAAGRRHDWVEVPVLPQVLYAGEAVEVLAFASDGDRLSPACTAKEPGCARGKRSAPMEIEEFHPITWSVDNVAKFGGAPGRLEGGETTPAGIFVAPPPTELMREGAAVCAKPVVVSVSSMAKGELAAEAA